MRAAAVVVAIVAAMLLPLGPFDGDVAEAEDTPPDSLIANATKARAFRDLGALSDFFTENAGQVGNPEVLYYSRSGGVAAGFAPGAVLVNLRERPPQDDPDLPTVLASPALTPALRGHFIRINFEGANVVLPQARGELPHRANFFLGDDPALWRTNVRNYREVVYTTPLGMPVEPEE